MNTSKDRKIKKLLIEYRDIITKLNQLGVIRTGKVVSDYGEYIVSQKLGLKLMSSAVNKGYDAIDKQGKKYEIKTRKSTAWNKATIFPVKKEQLETADFLIYVGFDDNWDVTQLLKIPTKEVKYNIHNRVVLNKELIKQYSIL